MPTRAGTMIFLHAGDFAMKYRSWDRTTLIRNTATLFLLSVPAAYKVVYTMKPVVVETTGLAVFL